MATNGLDDLSAFIAQTMKGGTLDGWAGVDTAGAAFSKTNEDLREQFEREASAMKRVFSTEDGQLALEAMLDMTLRQPAIPPGSQLPLDVLTGLCIAHNAQCEFVREILRIVAMPEIQDETEEQENG